MSKNALDTNRSFLYGDGFFESIRRRGGKWLFVDEHLDRMRKAADMLDLELPFQTPEELEKACVENTRDLQSDIVLRITFYRVGAGLYAPERPFQTQMHFMARLVNSDLDGYFPDQELSLERILAEMIRTKAVDTEISRNIRKPIHAFSSVKSTSAGFYAELLRSSSGRNDSEHIILNETGRVCECSSSNLLVQLDGQLFTPPPSDGPVQGTFIEWFKRYYAISFRSFQPEQLRYADALYRCNSVRGIQRLHLI